MTVIVGRPGSAPDGPSDHLGQRRGSPLRGGAGRAARGPLGAPEPLVLGVDCRLDHGAVLARVHAIEHGRAVERRRDMQPVALASFSLLAVGVGLQQPVPQHQRRSGRPSSDGHGRRAPLRRGRTPRASCRCDARPTRAASPSPTTISPPDNAASVPGIDRNRRAVRTSVAADDRLSSHRYANHAAPDVAPSYAHTPRVSAAATARAIAASTRQRSTSSSSTCAASAASVSDSGSTSHTSATRARPHGQVQHDQHQGEVPHHKEGV